MVGNAWYSIRVNVEIYALSHVEYTTLITLKILTRILYSDEQVAYFHLYSYENSRKFLKNSYPKCGFSKLIFPYFFVAQFQFLIC